MRTAMDVIRLVVPKHFCTLKTTVLTLSRSFPEPPQGQVIDIGEYSGNRIVVINSYQWWAVYHCLFPCGLSCKNLTLVVSQSIKCRLGVMVKPIH